MIYVKVGVFPGRLEEVALEDGATVKDALRAAGKDATGYEVRVNSESADLSFELEDDDRVLLTKQIKGNN